MPHAIKTTVVGSYPLPDWLAAAPNAQALDDATQVVFHTQELAGIDVVADGELYRFDINHPQTNGMIDYFVRPLDHVRAEVTREDLRRFAAKQEMGFRLKPAGVVTGPIGEGTLNLPQAYRRVRTLTRQPLKFTVTSPYMLARTLLDLHYGDLEKLTLALADVLAGQVREIGAEVVQIDEANITGNPKDACWLAPVLNRIFQEVPGTSAIHLCFGNYGGQSVQKGTWSALISFLNALQIDHVVAEIAFRGPAELEYFRELRPEIGMGLGVIDIKRTVIETPDEVARQIETAVRVLGPGRVTYVHPDCGFWMLKRSIADAKMRALVKGRDLFEGRT
jgi:5-methyltetrahydropteroyltriglutamate--homocysteine methyltransferase